MEIKKKFTVFGEEYEFINSSRSTRSGFAHDTELYHTNAKGHTYNLGHSSAHYLNRTWEAYRYQSVMLRRVGQLIDLERDYLLEQWKRKNDVSRMTQKRKKQYEREFVPSRDLIKYETLQFCIGGAYHNEWPSWYNANMGEREREILRNPGNVEQVTRTEERKVYKIYNHDNTRFCLYDVITKTFVG